MLVLDSHAHCGLTLPFERLASLWASGGIDGGVLISPVEEVYDRYDPYFTDNKAYQTSRQQVHKYLKSLMDKYIFAHWFVWNDFAYPQEEFIGIKWHRHYDEPKYRYDATECKEFLEYICGRGLLIMIEDELHHTLNLIERIDNRIPIIIPHCGALNGGYKQLKRFGVFEKPNVYVDTALATPFEIEDFASNYGVERILFGSDYPFGVPANERYKVEEVITGQDLEKVLSGNLLKLLKR